MGNFFAYYSQLKKNKILPQLNLHNYFLMDGGQPNLSGFWNKIISLAALPTALK